MFIIVIFIVIITILWFQVCIELSSGQNGNKGSAGLKKENSSRYWNEEERQAERVRMEKVQDSSLNRRVPVETGELQELEVIEVPWRSQIIIRETVEGSSLRCANENLQFVGSGRTSTKVKSENCTKRWIAKLS